MIKEWFRGILKLPHACVRKHVSRKANQQQPVTFKMAPWPEQGNEPKAPDKSCNKSGENSSFEASKVNVGNTEDLEVDATTSRCDDKQADDHNAHVSNLDDGQLRALLDEAIAYKCPKDREGKSNLFRELLQEAEANEDGESRRGLAGVAGSRYYSNSNRRRGRRDAQVSERQTRGGSLQNLVHASNAEFDPAAGFGGYHSGGSRTARKSKRSSTGSGSYGCGSVGGSGSGRDCSGVSVSARQREGGSLPSNVNVGGMLTLSGLDYHSTPVSLPFDDIKSCKQVAVRRKEFVHSSSSNEFTSMPVQASTINSSNSGGVESGSAVVPSNNNCIVPKSEFMVLDLGDYVGENTGENKGCNSGSVSVSNITSTDGADTDHVPPSAPQVNEKKNEGDSNGTEEGLELEVLQRAEMTTRVPNYTSRAVLEVGQGENKKISSNLNATRASENTGEVDSAVMFPLEILQCSEKTSSTVVVNGVEQNSLELQSSYNSVKSIMSCSSSSPRDDKSIINKDVNRLTFTHGSSKDCSGESKSKSLDENGNAVNRLESTNSNSSERKGKQRKTKTNNDRNVIMSQNIEGYRGDKDIDTVLKFIESNSDGKGTNKTKNTSSHSNGTVNFNSKQQRNCSRLIGCGPKARRERGVEDPNGDEDRMSKGRTASGKQVAKEHRGKGSKLKKSNSLEEISKTKLEDLTSNSKEGSENGTGSVEGNNTNNDESTSILVRRPKKQSTLDNGEFFSEKARVGDRRSWGTEEGQQYYCNDGVTVSADESSSGSGQNSRKRRGNATVSSTPSGDEKRKSDKEESVSVASFSAAGGSEETEFHVVTKKQRKKKRRSSSGGRGTSVSTGGSIFGEDGWRPYHNNYGTSYYQNRDGGGGSYYQRKTFTNTSTGFPPHDRTVERDSGGVMLYTQYRHHRPRSPDHLRRKSTSSVPPSDKSDSSDLDSVHSLPVSSTTPKLTLDQTSTSSGSTPQASYADIARMASTNVPSAPTHSHNYVNINLNSSRWPVMGTPKSAVTSVSIGSAISTSPPAATVTTSTCSNSVVTTPVVSSNPQFITGPKLNIGAPPVSGSKVAVLSACNSVLGPQSINAVPAPPASTVEDICSGTCRKEAEPVHSCVAVEQFPSGKTGTMHSPPMDTRAKKDAMTNTSLDYGAVSPIAVEEKEPSQFQSSPRPIETVVNFLQDGEYPSLEESLSSDKLKGVKIGQVHSVYSQLLTENCSGMASFTTNPHKDKSTNLPVTTLSENDKDNVSNEKNLSNLAVHSNIGAVTVDVSTTITSSFITTTQIPSSLQLCVPESAITLGVNSVHSDVVDIVKSKDANTCKTKNTGKKASNSGCRPPVIILDENDHIFSSSDGLGTVSELTFGFEVNEQLLMSDVNEDFLDNKAGASVFVSDSASGGVEETNPLVTCASATIPISACCSPGEDFTTRYKEPLIQPDNHDKIVTFVGLAWDDVLKEMNCAPIHSGGKVQYYSGQ